MNRAPSPSDSCPGCGIRYARFMPGQWGSGTKGNPSSAKRHAWAHHTRHCGQTVVDLCPFDVQSTLRDRAEGWLATHLSLGAAPARDVIAAAKQAGIGKRTLDYAKRAIGVQVERQSTGNRGRGCWYWHLPESQRERVAA